MILPEAAWGCPIRTGLAGGRRLTEGDGERIIQRQSNDENGVTIRDALVSGERGFVQVCRGLPRSAIAPSFEMRVQELGCLSDSRSGHLMQRVPRARARTGADISPSGRLRNSIAKRY